MTYERERQYEGSDQPPIELPARKPNFEGISVDLPFLSVRMASGNWSPGTPEENAYEQARRRVRARLNLYRHATTYFAVIAAAIFIDLVTGGGLSTFTLWLVGVWGALLLWQGFNVFIFPAVWSQETEDRMIQDELRRSLRDT